MFRIIIILILLSTIVDASENEVETEECTNKTSRERYKDLKANLQAIQAACGPVCDTTAEGTDAPNDVQGDGDSYRVIEKEGVPCRELFENPLFDRESEFDLILTKIPKYMVNDFTYQGRLKLRDDYRDDSKGVNHYKVWDQELRDIHFERFDKGTLDGSYGQATIDRIYHHLKETMPVKDKHVLVIGTERPWLETAILKAGAKHITTLDYIEIESQWSDVTTMTPGVFGEMYLNGTLPKFDAMVTFSSLEHSGLGRYGDALNPWGDLIAMARAWCVMAPGTKAMVGVPTGPDTVSYNSARIYGPIMYSQLFANWKVLHSDSEASKYSEKCYFCYQPVHIVERK